ncbi:DUF6082 family protein [Nonomuraea sp. NPDC049607]|uniref:DUF6082 family protein n=1 Tax=Nonomuraea sp. NPDC049607 TaxID=3154732 RepID=UPI00341B6FCD
MTRKTRRTTLTLSVLAGALLGGTLLLLSPLAAQLLAESIPGLDWALLSNIGQAYGAVAALLTALSLVGVMISTLVQARSVRIASEQTWRLTQLELAKLVIDDPKLVQFEGVPWHGPEDDLPLRLRILVNLWLEQWRSMHNFGLMDDSEIHRLASGLFAGEAGRRHWVENSDGYRADRRNVRTRAFSRILDEELANATRVPAVPITLPQAAPGKRHWRAAAVAGAALIVGVAIGRLR